MKKKLTLVLLVLCLCACMLVLAACNTPDGPDGPDGPDNPTDEWTPTGEDVTLISKGEISSYAILYQDGITDALNAAISLYKELTTHELSCSYPTTSATVNIATEILIGETDRVASQTALSYMNEQDAKDYLWAFYYRDGKLAIVANCKIAYGIAFDELFDKYIVNGNLTVNDTLKERGALSAEEYEEILIDAEIAAAEKRKKENKKLLDDLKDKIEEQRDSITANATFGTVTKNIGTSSWGKAPADPINEHPRLLITADKIEQIRDSVVSIEKTNETFKALYQGSVEKDAVLPVPKNAGTNETVGTDNIHNYDSGILEAIFAKALAYQLYDDEYYGYEAIYYIKNYLDSLDIIQIASDQCRQYGHVMFVTACVYDWCYDLLTKEDMTQLIAGVENRICRMKNNMGNAMEVGFPPSGQGSVSGHGSEYQIMRDYLAFAVAIYGENDSWWDYIAARVYNDYVATRNYYFKSGIAQQGTGYATARHIADLYSAWILKVATGENPYVGMEKTVKSFLGYEYDGQGNIFNDGDGTGDSKAVSSFSAMSYITAYLYADPTMLAQAEFGLGDIIEKGYGSGYSGLSCTTFVALHGLADIEPAKDRHEGMDLIQYNGYPLGQYVIRESWTDPASAAVIMRIKERTTANHEHGDSGTFEIYYKGMLTSDGGCYNNYGHYHTRYFHQSTISHNGLIIFDPSKWNPNSTAVATKWYSGSQTKPGEASTLSGWLSSKAYDTGKVLGYQHGYIDGDESKPLYAYIAGDITAAYESTQATNVDRSMLTVYTGDEQFPMVFFVHDAITSYRANFSKRFLLQISSFREPTIDEDEQTIITENGDGRLVLTCLSDDVAFNAFGGRTLVNGSLDAANSLNYQINGVQCVPQKNTSDDKHWGRVEIEYTGKSASNTFMNVLYVTDKGNKKMAKVKDVSATGGTVEGAVFDDSIVAIFATSDTRATSQLTCTTRGGDSMSYYVAGVAAGEWKVTVDDKSIGTFEATEEGGLLTFTAPAGKVVISPAK